MISVIKENRICVGCNKIVLSSHSRIKANLVSPDKVNEDSASSEWGTFHEDCFLSVVGSASLDLGALARKTISVHGR